MIQMMNLAAQHKRIADELRAAVGHVVDNCQFIKGEAVGRFEENLSRHLSVRHVLTCGNGTDALWIALRALGMSEGDEVITTSMSFVAAAEAAALLGLRPVFADVDEKSYNATVDTIGRHVTGRTKAIIVTHLFGNPCDMDGIMKLAEKHGLYVIEDAAQSLGGWCMVGGEKRMLGTIGHVGCTSFFPSKNLGCMGDGGAVFTNDDRLYETMRMTANHGGARKYVYETIGVNSRLDTIQAAILDVKLKHLEEFNSRRRETAGRYTDGLSGCKNIVTPMDQPGHVYHQYTIRVVNGKRDELHQYLEENGVKSMIYYPLMLHMQPAYKHLTEVGLPTCERLQEEVMSLPICSETTVEDTDKICQLIRQWDKTN